MDQMIELLHSIPRHSVSPNRGFTLVETVFALAVAGLALTGAMLLNSHQLRLVKSTRATGAAALCLEERVEQLRLRGYDKMTNRDFVKSEYFASAPRSAAPLGNFREKITISAYPNKDACEPLIVEKVRGRSPEQLSNGLGLEKQLLARVDLEMWWRGDNDRSRSRSVVTVISNGGVTRSNLPAMGSAAGAPPATPASAPRPASTPWFYKYLSGSGYKYPDGTYSYATPAPTRGNTGGKAGKK